MSMEVYHRYGFRTERCEITNIREDVVLEGAEVEKAEVARIWRKVL